MGWAKKWVQRPHYRSKVEVDRKKESKRNPADDGDWTFWVDRESDPAYNPSTIGWIEHNKGDFNGKDKTDDGT